MVHGASVHALNSWCSAPHHCIQHVSDRTAILQHDFASTWILMLLPIKRCAAPSHTYSSQTQAQARQLLLLSSHERGRPGLQRTGKYQGTSDASTASRCLACCCTRRPPPPQQQIARHAAQAGGALRTCPTLPPFNPISHDHSPTFAKTFPTSRTSMQTPSSCGRRARTQMAAIMAGTARL